MSALDSAIFHFVAEDNKLIAAAFGASALLAATAVYYSTGPKDKDKEHDFPKLPGIQFFHAWSFFQRKFDFLHEKFEVTMGKSFSFDVVNYKMIALNGDEASRVFYTNPGFNLSQGFMLMMGAAPKSRNFREVDIEATAKDVKFRRTLERMMGRERQQDFIPALLQDIIGKADRWGNSGRIDPFSEISELVILMTARMCACDAMTKNDADLKKVAECFWTIMTGATPAALMLPWFPSPTRVKIILGYTKMCSLVRKYVDARRLAETTSDTIDVMIAEGEETEDIVQFIVLINLTGIGNMGTVCSWVLVDLAIHSEWKAKCKKEIQEMIVHHLGDSVSFATVCDKLSAIPLEAWENELPVLEACIRETQRIALTGIALRRNLRDDVPLGDKLIKPGDFLVYLPNDIHMNPEYYPNPHKHDPGRWLRPDPVPNITYPFLGWGAGRHPCPGVKVAKFEMKLILVVMLMRYEFELVDERGRFPNPLPVLNHNSPRGRPLGETCYFEFKKVME